MPRLKTDAEFKKEVYDLVGNEYTFLDSYVNAKTKLRVKHTKCGNTYEVTPSNFLEGQRCPHCVAIARGKDRIKTNAQFKREILNLVGDEYEFLDTYVNAKAKLRVKHNKCNNIYKVSPSNFLKGSRCPFCSIKAKKTDAEFKQQVYDLVGNEYVFLDSYVNSYTKIKVKHNKCNNVYKVQPSAFLRGRRCPFCSSKASGKARRKPSVQFQQEAFNLVGAEYTFLECYQGAFTKIKVKHEKCGRIYTVTPTDFLSHQTRCPYCNSPKGETIITKILDTLNINYESQKTFDNLRDKDCLSYDFYIPDQSILIEYQGIQHYEPIDHFGGEDQFKVQQKHDKMKANYANNHHYNLIAIPYTEDTFSKIKKYLIKHGLKN